jgi:hypothetical protein
MPLGLSGRYDVTGVFTPHRNDDGQHSALRHADDPDPLLAEFDVRIDIVEAVRVFECGIREIDAVLATIQGSLSSECAFHVLFTRYSDSCRCSVHNR